MLHFFLLQVLVINNLITCTYMKIQCHFIAIIIVIIILLSLSLLLLLLLLLFIVINIQTSCLVFSFVNCLNVILSDPSGIYEEY